MGGLVEPSNHMKKYIGKMEVKAVPMTYGDAFKDGVIPGNSYIEEYDKEEGYKIVCADGATDWLPKNVFEATYRLAETPVDRMHIEYADLREKSGNLNAFIENSEDNACTRAAWAMLHVQEAAMEDYMQALALRTTLMETGQGGFTGLPFSSAITLLEKGFAIRRAGWNGKGLIVFKQVPAKINSDIIPKMQSLPVEAKRLILESAQHIDYTSQCLIYNQQTGRADSWVPSISDVFSKDWELVE